MGEVMRIKPIADIFIKLIGLEDHIAGLKGINAIIEVMELAIEHLPRYSAKQHRGRGGRIDIAPGNSITFAVGRAQIANV